MLVSRYDTIEEFFSVIYSTKKLSTRSKKQKNYKKKLKQTNADAHLFQYWLRSGKAVQKKAINSRAPCSRLWQLARGRDHGTAGPREQISRIKQKAWTVS